MTRWINAAVVFLFFGFLQSPLALARLEYDSSQLMMKNADQVEEIIKKKIKMAGDIQAAQESDDDEIRAEPEALEQLKDALRIAFSRPDQDGSRAGFFDRLRQELRDLNSLEIVMGSLADEAISLLKGNSESAKVHATYVYILENMMAEIKPEIEKNITLKKVVERVRDANIRISSDVRKQLLMRTMNKPRSPSETADALIDAAEKAGKAAEKKQK